MNSGTRLYFIALSTMESWDTCVLNDLQQAEIAKLDEIIATGYSDNHLDQLVENSNDKNNSNTFNDDSDTFEMKDLLTKTELSCHIFLDQIDEVLQTLSNLSTIYYEVTGRTNTLMRSCEDLLEQQHKLQATIESMREFLLPFNDIEEISNLLGDRIRKLFYLKYSTYYFAHHRYPR